MKLCFDRNKKVLDTMAKQSEKRKISMDFFATWEGDYDHHTGSGETFTSRNRILMTDIYSPRRAEAYSAIKNRSKPKRVEPFFLKGLLTGGCLSSEDQLLADIRVLAGS